MRTAACVLAAALLVGIAAHARAASDGAIDCGKAELADEKAICADPALVRDDARMATLYGSAMSRSGMGERGDLQDGQTAWLERRQACKADAACLHESYAARIGQIQKVIDALVSRGPS